MTTFSIQDIVSTGIYSPHPYMTRFSKNIVRDFRAIARELL